MAPMRIIQDIHCLESPSMTHIETHQCPNLGDLNSQVSVPEVEEAAVVSRAVARPLTVWGSLFPVSMLGFILYPPLSFFQSGLWYQLILGQMLEAKADSEKDMGTTVLQWQDGPCSLLCPDFFPESKQSTKLIYLLTSPPRPVLP